MSQKNSERQFNKLRNKTDEQKEYFTKDIETKKKKAKQILVMKNTINEIKKIQNPLKNRADVIGDRISNLEDRNIEMLQVEEERKLRFFFKDWHLS